MKKTIAALLACIMIIACVPFTALAASETISGVEMWDTSKTIAQGDTITITGTVTVSNTVTNRGAIVIEGGSLIIAGAGRLYNEGTVTVKANKNGTKGSIMFNGTGTDANSATLYNAKNGVISIASTCTGIIGENSTAYNYGDIVNSDLINIEGELLHNVTIPGSYSLDFDYRETWNRLPTTVRFDVSYYMYEPGDTDDAYTNIDNFKKYPCDTKTDVLVPDGEKLFVMITPKIGADGTGEWVDASRIKIKAEKTTHEVTTILDTKSENAVRILEYGGVFTVTPSNSFEIEVATKKYQDLVKIFDITLPRTEAYYVITDNNDVDRVDVEFGDTLSFRVVLEEEYDKSDVYVYVNSLYQEPADYGYYRISGPLMSDGFATAGGVQDDLTITVMGVTSNESQEQMSGIVAMLQEIFSIIKEIFSYFTSIFDGLGSIGGETTV